MAQRRPKPTPEVSNAPAEITAANIDPAWVYEIDAGPEVVHKGIVANFTHDPNTKAWIAPTEERRRFFILDNDAQSIIELPAAMQMNLRRAFRKGPAEQSALEQYMAIHYTTAA